MIQTLALLAIVIYAGYVVDRINQRISDLEFDIQQLKKEKE